MHLHSHVIGISKTHPRHCKQQLHLTVLYLRVNNFSLINLVFVLVKCVFGKELGILLHLGRSLEHSEWRLHGDLCVLASNSKLHVNWIDKRNQKISSEKSGFIFDGAFPLCKMTVTMLIKGECPLMSSSRLLIITGTTIRKKYIYIYPRCEFVNPDFKFILVVAVNKPSAPANHPL